ncbi:hypothetical protein NDU88_003934 [Pleurodeles waltl]|uniref:Uncharacterized protein n=1 Tax=Pleurodeles waltl TaxID=8319 RepID=A0AAV7TPW1_PLEWA|nr:hypothetical protein NDU88_003934 [Pleurodeles waltl]
MGCGVGGTPGSTVMACLNPDTPCCPTRDITNGSSTCLPISFWYQSRRGALDRRRKPVLAWSAGGGEEPAVAYAAFQRSGPAHVEQLGGPVVLRPWRQGHWGVGGDMAFMGTRAT